MVYRHIVQKRDSFSAFQTYKMRYGRGLCPLSCFMAKDPKLKKAGVSGYNKPKRTPNHPTKSHVVVAKVGDKTKTIRFGQQGVKGAGKNPKTKKDKARRKSYYARHNAQDSNPSKLSARYWSHKVKW